MQRPITKICYLSFFSKTCVTSRRIDITSLEFKDLPCISVLRKLRWNPILKLDDLMFESYTKLFYTNLDAQRNDISSKVYLKGREFEITHSLLNHILGILDEGTFVTLRKGELGIKNYNFA